MVYKCLSNSNKLSVEEFKFLGSVGHLPTVAIVLTMPNTLAMSEHVDKVREQFVYCHKNKVQMICGSSTLAAANEMKGSGGS